MTIADTAMQEAQQALEQNRAQLLDLLGSLRAEDWGRRIPDNAAWTVQDTAAHVAGYQLTAASLVESVVEGRYTKDDAERFRLDDHNASLVEERRGMPVDALLRELQDNRAVFLRAIERVRPADWEKIAWRPAAGAITTVQQMTLRERVLRFAAHDTTHGAQITAALGR